MIYFLLPIALCLSITLSNCGYRNSKTKSLDYDSTLANLPNCAFWYQSTSDSFLPESLWHDFPFKIVVREKVAQKFYIYRQFQNNQKRDTLSSDTFFITPKMDWYYRYDAEWQLFFSPSSFEKKQKTVMKKKDVTHEYTLVFIPDTIQQSDQYGPVYVYDLRYGLDEEVGDFPAKYYFAPEYGFVIINIPFQKVYLFDIDTL